jgi:hypothetical protein
MTTFQIISSIGILISTVIGVSGLALSIRNTRYNNAAPQRAIQEKLQADLVHHLKTQNRLTHAVNHPENVNAAPSPLTDDLERLRSFLRSEKHRFNTPTPAQLDAVINTLTDALKAIDDFSRQPRNDTAFLDTVQEIKRNLLQTPLESALADINVLYHGLHEIEMNPMGVRKQRKLFTALD